MLSLIKKILHLSSSHIDETYVQILDFGERNISFILPMNSPEEAEQMLLMLIQLKHPKCCSITTSKTKENISNVVVDISSTKKIKDEEIYKLIACILDKQEEIKSNGQSNRET